MSLAKKVEDMKNIERKNKNEKDELKARNNILKGEIDISKRKLENEKQLAMDYQNEIKNMDQRKQREIQMFKVKWITASTVYS